MEGHKWFFPDFQPIRDSKEPVCIDLSWQNTVLTTLHLTSAVLGYQPKKESVPVALVYWWGLARETRREWVLVSRALVGVMKRTRRERVPVAPVYWWG
jgi:hypothetical protein